MFHLAGCSAQQPVAQGNGRPAGDSARPNFPQESSEPVCRNTPDLEIGSAPGIELLICKHNYMPLVAEVWCMYSFYQSERFFYLEFCLMHCILCNLWSKKNLWFAAGFSSLRSFLMVSCWLLQALNSLEDLVVFQAILSFEATKTPPFPTYFLAQLDDLCIYHWLIIAYF